MVIKVNIRMFLEWEKNSGKLYIISGKLQNNVINDVKQISLSHVIAMKTMQETSLYIFQIQIFLRHSIIYIA